LNHQATALSAEELDAELARQLQEAEFGEGGGGVDGGDQRGANNRR
jgi:hypothetical protein